MYISLEIGINLQYLGYCLDILWLIPIFKEFIGY